MRIIISPAKKMNSDIDSLPHDSLPCFLPKTKQILQELKKLDYIQLKKLWKCNDKIAELNMARIENMNLETMLTPALLAYEGIQYRYMAPGVFSTQEFDYIRDHLRILSGFYGLLRPFDGVVPYRLEMQAKLSVAGTKDLYEFWGDSIAALLTDESECILNLASKEYSIVVSRHLSDNVNFINCSFAEEAEGKLVEKGTMCKMARGEMVRYMAENQVADVRDIRNFDRLNYSFSAKYSDEKNYVFVLNK